MITVITLRLRNLNEQYMEEVSFWRPCRRGAELCAFGFGCGFRFARNRALELKLELAKARHECVARVRRMAFTDSL